MENQLPEAIVVGAGPSGLAAAACLNRLSVPNILLEREDCFASLWKKKSYDRLHLHLKKQVCELPHMPFPSSFPTYVPRKQFVQYLDDYVSHFQIKPMYQRLVQSANYDEVEKKWRVRARNIGSGEVEEYSGRFLVVATGETSDAFTPEVEGLSDFTGEVIHSTEFKSGDKYRGKRVLVVGSGNSGMEIALDLSNHSAKTSIAIRSPIHILSTGMVNLAVALVKYIPLYAVDALQVMLSRLWYGDLTKYGIQRPAEGPFSMKLKYGKYPIIDVGTCSKIKSGEVQVLPAIARVKGDEVVFANGSSHPFDAIIFATGFKTSTHKWLRGDDYLLGEDGISKLSFPNNWKGKNGLYCAGLSRRGFYGAAMDAQSIAADINKALFPER
ncbi:probable indole-3-pyruvate monooxygenase YUCCA10 [Diospyros lotus]|uniref:probable indole-3-pyruvate monooxygenase YUCCA10 n=1 Tax=Diospyros lotus TaxID=55363 RepID=UPI00225A0EFC|nr:probable indole-3-pyruvate monooxygenase YUCCA10 [Diospyros lotus]